MAGDFYSGLARGLQQGAEQNDRDRARSMELDRQQALEYQREAESQRSEQRLGLERERALRQNRDSDFNYEQGQRRVQQEKERQAKIADAWKSTFTDKEVAYPDGSVEKVKADQNDPTLWRDFYGRVGQIYGESGDAAKVKEIRELRTVMEREGSAEAVRGLLTGDTKKAASLAQSMGLRPETLKVAVRTDPKSGLRTNYVTGVDIKGNPYEQDLTTVMMALGLPDIDPQKGANERVVRGAAMSVAQQNADANTTTAGAAVTRATALRERAAGTKTSAEGARLVSFMSRKVPLNPALGAVMTNSGAIEDDDHKRQFVLANGGTSLNSGRFTTADEARRETLAVYNALEASVIANARFVRDGRNYRPAAAGEEGIPLNRIPDGNVKLTLRNAAIDAEIARRKQAFNARRADPAQPAEDDE